jgi:Uma2 family endonuclease
MHRPQRNRVTVGEYLRAEEHRTIRHEYYRGEVYAMSGGTARHSQIAANIIMHLGNAARHGRCRVFTSDFKVQPSDDAVYYPDVSVVCAPQDGSAVLTASPCLVVEITSRGTARIDRGEKAEEYRNCPALRAYLVVDQYRRRVTSHSRDASGAWQEQEFLDAGSVPIPCPTTDLTLDQIYENVEMPPLRVGEPELEVEEEDYVLEDG